MYIQFTPNTIQYEGPMSAEALLNIVLSRAPAEYREAIRLHPNISMAMHYMSESTQNRHAQSTGARYTGTVIISNWIQLPIPPETTEQKAAKQRAEAEAQRQAQIAAQQEAQHQAALRAQQEAARLAEAARRVKLQREQKLAEDERQRDAAIQVFRDNASRHIASYQQSDQNGHSQMNARLREMKNEHVRRLTQVKNVHMSQKTFNTSVIEAQLKIIEARQTQQYVAFQLSQIEQLKSTLSAQLSQIQHEFTQASQLAYAHHLILQTQYNTDTSGDPQWWAVLASKQANRLTLSGSFATDGQKTTGELSQRINMLQNEQNQLQQRLAEEKIKLHQAQTTLTEALLTECEDTIRDEAKEISSLFGNAQIARDRLMQQEMLASQQLHVRQTIMDESLTDFSELMHVETERRTSLTFFESKRLSARSQANQAFFNEMDQLDHSPQGDQKATMAQSARHSQYVTQVQSFI